jgi:hypothetical protein
MEDQAGKYVSAVFNNIISFNLGFKATDASVFDY